MNLFHTATLTCVLLLTACSHSGDLQRSHQQHIQIYKPDGARQCEGGGISPEAMQSELQGIRVYSARKSILSGMMFPTVCGGITGSINVYTIAAKNQAEAQQRGFSVLPQKNIHPISDGLYEAIGRLKNQPHHD